MQQNPDGLWSWPAPPPPRPPRRRGGLGPLLVVAVLAAGAGAAGAVALRETTVQPPDSSSAGQIPPAAAPAGTGKTTLNVQAVANAVEPGVVDVVAPDAYSGLVSEGTGMVLSPDGLVLTNNHVIRDSTNVKVQLVTSSGKTYAARVLGYDATDDVALLQATGASGLHTIASADSSHVRVGQPVLALGNAEGQGGSPTVAPGSVTGLHKTISPSDSSTGATETLHGTIQTSAQVAQGDSGGPLANAAGQVVGMVTASGSSADFGSSGTVSGYAIPINSALSIAHQISSGSASARIHIGLPGFIGVQVADADAGCTFGAGAVASGALICSVLPGTAASRSGLAAGDVITSANGRSISSAAGLTSATSGLHAGAVVRLGYVNINDMSRTARLVLGSGPAG
jgi:S1-C subfamily serine protease